MTTASTAFPAMAADVPAGRLAGGDAGTPGTGRHRSALGLRSSVSLESEDDTIDALRDAVVRESNGDIAVRDTPDALRSGGRRLPISGF
jgi:hypothetical protein